jgi:para-nitrobenzyl esterase
MDPIKIDTGYITGTIMGEPGEEVRIYRGVPYAAPPVGNQRWTPPRPAVPWPGIRECTEFGSQAAQGPSILSPPRPIETSEDCLYLNILTPAKNKTDRLPVMVWMHGGGFEFGNGNDLLVNGVRLPQKGIVLVNVNMRLGAIGLLAHPLLSKESPKGVSGNYMFLDMLAALEWVQRNIEAFGGDADNVTIFGESGGGAKVADLVVSPLAKGLFHRAICESGAAFPPFAPGKTLKEMEEIGVKVFEKLGLNRETDPLSAARSIPWDKVVEAGKAPVEGSAVGLGPWDATVDGWFLPDIPANIFDEAGQNPLSIIVGSNLGELTGPGTILMPHIIPTYVKMLNAAQRAGVKNRYAFIFDQIPAGWKSQGCVSTHAMELPYVFGDYDNSTGWWAGMFGLTSQSGAKTPDPGVTKSDRDVSEVMMKMWARFAKTGNPNIEEVVEWPAYEADSDQYLYINDPLEAKSGFSKVCQEE